MTVIRMITIVVLAAIQRLKTRAIAMDQEDQTMIGDDATVLNEAGGECPTVVNETGDECATVLNETVFNDNDDRWTSLETETVLPAGVTAIPPNPEEPPEGPDEEATTATRLKV